MSLIDRFKAFFKGGGSTEDNILKSSLVNSEMQHKIKLWLEMYEGKVKWTSSSVGVNENQPLNLPSLIASDIARQVVLEMAVSIGGENQRSEYIDAQIAPLKNVIRRYVEYACAGGGICFKPYVIDGTIKIDAIAADAFFPLEYDSSNCVVSAAFVSTVTLDNKTYTRVETHRKTQTGYDITNEAFMYRGASNASDGQNSGLYGGGTRVLLSTVPQWADIAPEVNIKSLTTPLFSYFPIPLGNTINIGSPIGCSVYSRAVELIKEADKQWSRLLWEFEGAELAIDVSEDAFFIDKHGKPMLPSGKERLFRPNKFSVGDGITEIFKEFSPEIRDQSLINGLNTILERIEDTCGLSRGVLSIPQTEAKTATELKINRQRSYATITDIQRALEHALDGLIAAIDALATLYNLAPMGDYTTAYVWDDSVIIDAETERMRDMQEVTMGLMQPWEYRVKWFGNDELTAKKILAESGQSNDKLMGFEDDA
jgi:A118 family predicted phage portal protein